MEAKQKVLDTMKQAGQPLNAGKIAELSGLDRKEVDKAMKALKEEGDIVSPHYLQMDPRRIIPPAPPRARHKENKGRAFFKVAAFIIPPPEDINPK